MDSDDCVIGIDIGGTTTSIGIINRAGIVRSRTTVATHADRPADDLVGRLCEIVSKQLLPRQSAVIAGIGIGAPNANYHLGTIENPVNLDWGISVNLAELFRQRLDLPVAVTNDANAAAIGELLYGGASGMKHAVVITLGTGLGSGFIVDGVLLHGADGFAGELGHTTVDPSGRHCACGKQGCLEAYVSAPGLCRTVCELLAQRCDCSRLGDVSFNALSAKQVCEAACEGDPIALAAFDVTARILGVKLADAVAHTSPEAIFLSGGLAAAGELLIAPTRRYMEDSLFKPYRGKVKLLRSLLPEGNGAMLGAAALAWCEVDKTAPPIQNH